ncbi:MAG TPA: type II secretion system protein, partial [Mesorhizobium sp.]|nr:type II secretion system protein [Mesorhizobium sp.]
QMKPNKLNRRRGGFTLVEIMIVVAIIALLVSIAVPGFVRARKRTQASRVLNDLRHLDGAIDQYALETNKPGDWIASFTDLRVYLKDGGALYTTGNDILGNQYGPSFTVESPPKVPPNTWAALSDVAGTDFWSPYL